MMKWLSCGCPEQTEVDETRCGYSKGGEASKGAAAESTAEQAERASGGGDGRQRQRTHLDASQNHLAFVGLQGRNTLWVRQGDPVVRDLAIFGDDELLPFRARVLDPVRVEDYLNPLRHRVAIC